MLLKRKFDIVIILFFVLLLATLSPSISGDGGAFIRPSSYEAWASLPEEKQMGIINYQNGNQDLIIVINIKQEEILDGESAAWLFPVPSDPTDVDIELLDNIPNLGGKNIIDVAKDKTADSFNWMYLSQLYSVPIGMVLTALFDSDGRNTADLGFSMAAQSGEGDSGERVTIHEHIEEMGLTTELVGTTDTNAFNNYLLENNLNLTNDALSIIDEYVGDEYSFVVSWISNVTEFMLEVQVQYPEPNYYQGYDRDPFYSLGVWIKFPTDKIYYPMKLTSIYGETKIPILLQILRYVTPESNDIPTQDFDVNYYYDEEYRIYDTESNQSKFFSGYTVSDYETDYFDEGYVVSNVKYTEITIDSESNNFNEDIWFKDGAPLGVVKHDAFVSFNLPIALMIFIICSCLASLIAGLLIFKDKQELTKVKLFVLGLSNLATIFGFYLMLKALALRKNREERNDDYILLMIPIGFLTFFNMYVFLISSVLNEFAVCLLILPVIFILSLVFLIFLIVKDRKTGKFLLVFSVFFLMFIFPTQFIIYLLL